MGITSERQKRYSEQGFEYYTLFRGDSMEDQPKYAQPGDLFEVYGSETVYKYKQTGKKGKWEEAPDEKSQTSGDGGGGSLPANFPAEGSENANKFIGFDENGDYEAKNAPTGGASSWNDLTDRPFYEETTPGIDISDPDFTSDDAVEFDYTLPTVGTAPCKALRVADYLPKSRPLGAEFTVEISAGGSSNTDTMKIIDDFIVDANDGYMIVREATPYIFFAEHDNAEFVLLDGNDDTIFDVTFPTAGTYFVQIDASEVQGFDTILSVIALEKDGETVVHKLDGKFLPAPMTVTITDDLVEADTYNGDKTFGEVYDAFIAGKTVTFVHTNAGDVDAGVAVGVEISGSDYSVNFMYKGGIVKAEGLENDMISFEDK